MIFGALPVRHRRKLITTANKQIKKEASDMSLVTGTARTGEAAAVAEAPLFNGMPLILGTHRDQHLLCLRSYLRAGVRPIRGARFVRARVHHLLDDHPLHRGAGRIDLLPRLGRLDVEDPRHGPRERPTARGNAPYLQPDQLDYASTVSRFTGAPATSRSRTAPGI